MKRRTLAWIILGTATVHVVAFLILSRMNLLPRTKYQAPANFGYKQTTYIDPVTGNRTIEREIRVSTKLAPPGVYEARPKAEANDLKSDK